MTATTAAQYAALRIDGRYRVIDRITNEYVTTCASRAKAEAKAAKLNEAVAAEEPVMDWAEQDAAVAADRERADAREAAEAEESAAFEAHRAEAAELIATLDAAKAERDAAKTAAVAPMAATDPVAAAKSRPVVPAAPAAEEKLVNVYVGASVAELVMARRDDADAAVASVARKLADRQPNGQDYRHVKLSAAERVALSGVATAIENDATSAGQGLLARAARTLRGRLAAV